MSVGFNYSADRLQYKFIISEKNRRNGKNYPGEGTKYIRRFVLRILTAFHQRAKFEN